MLSGLNSRGSFRSMIKLVDLKGSALPAEMCFFKNMSFWKVWRTTDSIAVFSAFVYIGSHVAKLMFDILGKTFFV